MSADPEPVSPITMEDHINPATTRSPEITEQGGEHNTYDNNVTKTEHSVYDAPRPRQTKTGLSWRTRFAGRSTTLNVNEVENGDFLLLFCRTYSSSCI
jgi:hypothetical protein